MKTHFANQKDDQSIFSFTNSEPRESADFHITDLTSDMPFYPNTIKPLFAPNVSQELSTIPCTVIDVASCDVISLSDFDLPNMGGKEFIGPKTSEEAHRASESILYEELPELRRIAREIVSSPLLSQKAERTLFFGQNEKRRKRPRKNTVTKAVTEKSWKHVADIDNEQPLTKAYDELQAMGITNDTSKTLQDIDSCINLNSETVRKFQNRKSSTDGFVMLDSDKQATNGFRFSRDFTTDSISSSSKSQRQTKFSNPTNPSDLNLEMEANDYYKDNDCLEENLMSLGLEKDDFEELQNDQHFTEKFADLYLERQTDDDFRNMESFGENFTRFNSENQEIKYQATEDITNNFSNPGKEYQNDKKFKNACFTDDFETAHREKKARYSFPNSDTFTDSSSTFPLHYNTSTLQDSNYNDASRPKSFGLIEDALKTDLNQESFIKTAPFSDPPTPTQQPAYYSYNALGRPDLHSYPDQSLFSQTYRNVPRSTSNSSRSSQISEFSHISANVLAVNSQAHAQALNAAQKDLAVYTNSTSSVVFDSHLFTSNSLNRTGSYKNKFRDANGYNGPSVFPNPSIVSTLPKVDINRMTSRNALITTTTTTTTIIQSPLLSTSNRSFNEIGQHNVFGLIGAIELENLGSQERGISSISDTLNFMDSNDSRFNSHNATTNKVDQVNFKQRTELREDDENDYQHFIKERINHEINVLNGRRDDSMSSNSIQPSLISVVSKPSVSSNDQISRTNESNSNISQNTQSSKHSEVSKYGKNVNYLQQAQYSQPHSASLSSLVSGISNLVVDIGQLSSPEQPIGLENKIKDSVSIKSLNESVEGSQNSTSLRKSISENSTDNSITSQDRYQRQHFILIPCNQNLVVDHSPRLSNFSFWSYESTDNPESVLFKNATNTEQQGCIYPERHDSDAKSCTKSLISLESLNKPLPLLPETENSNWKTQQNGYSLENLKQSSSENGVDTESRLQSLVIPKDRVRNKNGEQNIGLKAFLSQKQPATTFENINFNAQRWSPNLKTKKASMHHNRTSYVSNNYLNVIGLEDDDSEDFIRDLGLVKCIQPKSSPKTTRCNLQEHNNEFQPDDISKPSIDQGERDTGTHPEIENISTSLYTDVKKPFNKCIESEKLPSSQPTHPDRISTGYLFHVPSVYSKHIPHPSLQPSTLDSAKLAVFATKAPETDSSPRFSFHKPKRLSRVEHLSKLFSHRTKLPSNSSQRTLDDIEKDSKELTQESIEFENDVQLMVGGLNYLNELGKTMSNESEKLTKTKVKDFFQHIYKTPNTRENQEEILGLDHKKPTIAQNKRGLKTNRKVLRKDSKVVKNRNRPNWQQARLFKDLNFSAKKEEISLDPKENLAEMEKDPSSFSLVPNTTTQAHVEQYSIIDNNCNKNKTSEFSQSNSSRRSYGHTHHLHFSGYPPMRPHVLSCAVSPRQSASSADALPFKPLVPEHMYNDQLPSIWKHPKGKRPEEESVLDTRTSTFKSKFKTMMGKIHLKKV